MADKNIESYDASVEQYKKNKESFDASQARKSEVIQEYFDTLSEEVKKGVISIQQYEKELKKLHDQDIIAIKSRIKENEQLRKLNAQAVREAQKQILSPQNSPQMPQQSVWQKIKSGSKEFFGIDNTDKLTNLYTQRQRASSIKDMFSGNLLGGFKSLATTIPGVAKFLAGPWGLALNVAVSGLMKLDSALAKASKTASTISGGLGSEYVGNKWKSTKFLSDTKKDLFEIGMQKEFENITSTMQKSFGIKSYLGNQRELTNTLAYVQKGLGVSGVSADTSNSLVAHLKLLEGKSQQGIYAQIGRIVSQKNNILSTDQYVQESMSLLNQSKSLGINFEWASRQVSKFEKELSLGTISLSDFASINRSLKTGSISQNAGIGSLITNYAARKGLNLPSEILNSNPVGQGFALTTAAMSGNKDVLGAYEGQLNEMIAQMGGKTNSDKAGLLQLILQSRGVNISGDLAKKAIKSDGSIDLEGAGIMGKKALKRQADEEAEAKKYTALVKNYYTGTSSFQEKVLTRIDKLISNTTSDFAEGMSGNVGSDPTIMGAIGYSLSTGLWKGLGEMFEQIGKDISSHSTQYLY